MSSSVQNDVEIHGSVIFKGDLNFCGQLTGGSIKGQNLTVGSGASITGNVDGDSLTLLGTVKGDVRVAGKCEIKDSAQLLGNLTAQRLVMSEGATFVGKAQITPNKPPGAGPEPSKP
jgi:cytoskeletal protein CcmA (bactofilin family)